MVGDSKQHVLLCCLLQQVNPEQGAGREIKRFPHESVNVLATRCGFQLADISNFKRDRCCVGDNLYSFAIRAADKAGPQRFMATDQCIHGILQCGLVDSAIDLHGPRHVVGCCARCHLIEEPESLLSE